MFLIKVYQSSFVHKSCLGDEDIMFRWGAVVPSHCVIRRSHTVPEWVAEDLSQAGTVD